MTPDPVGLVVRKNAASQKEYLDRKEAARFLTEIGCTVSPKTLANYASNKNRGKGPPYERLSWTRIRYRRADLENWVQARITKVE